MKRRAVLLAALGAVALAGCGQPVAPARLEYVGEWQGAEMRLLIAPDGRVEYQRQRDGNRVSLTAFLQAFEGDDFIVGLGPFKTRFVVSQPPRQEAGTWKMTVDGVELRRVRALGGGGTWT